MNPTVTAMTGGHVLVAGAGVAGRGAARLLAHLGARVTVADDDADRSARLAAECGGRRLGVTDACDLLATGHPPAGTTRCRPSTSSSCPRVAARLAAAARRRGGRGAGRR